jgi:Cu2+-exporting ATPase
MACSSGCCGPRPSSVPDTTEEPPREQKTPQEGTNNRHGNELEVGKGALPTQNPGLELAAGAIGQTGTELIQDGPDHVRGMPIADCRDGCCVIPVPHDSGSPGCRSTSTETREAPSCCEGKPSPCCDASCLDRLALRACDDVASKSDCFLRCFVSRTTRLTDIRRFVLPWEQRGKTL